MRIHSDTLTHADIVQAVADLDGVDVRATRHGSRKRKAAWNVTLVADKRPGRRWRNSGASGASPDEAAATWDEWGVFLSWLYSHDPDATSDYYDGAEHFHWSTDGRFRNVVALDMHDQHRWENGLALSTSVNNAVGCKCGAVRRTLIRLSWADFIAQASERSERVNDGITPSEARSDFRTEVSA